MADQQKTNSSSGWRGFELEISFTGMPQRYVLGSISLILLGTYFTTSFSVRQIIDIFTIQSTLYKIWDRLKVDNKYNTSYST